MRHESDSDLQLRMQLELTLGGGPIGTDLASAFFRNLAILDTKTHGFGSPLSDLVKASPEFRSEHESVKDFIRDAVREMDFRGIIDYRELAEARKKVPPPGLGFPGFQRLHVLIGSFQGVDVYLHDFNADPVGRTYDAELVYHFFDHFGVDNSDAIPDSSGHGSPGQMAFWILQRERHRTGNMPYITEVVINRPIVGTATECHSGRCRMVEHDSAEEGRPARARDAACGGEDRGSAPRAGIVAWPRDTR